MQSSSFVYHTIKWRHELAVSICVNRSITCRLRFEAEVSIYGATYWECSFQSWFANTEEEGKPGCSRKSAATVSRRSSSWWSWLEPDSSQSSSFTIKLFSAKFIPLKTGKLLHENVHIDSYPSYPEPMFRIDVGWTICDFARPFHPEISQFLKLAASLNWKKWVNLKNLNCPTLTKRINNLKNIA